MENTLGAVEAAIAADYAVEIDLQLTADGGLVINHDETLDRTTREKGRILDRTLDELRSIQIAGSDETLSSVTDLLALTAGRAALFIELKAPPRHEDKARMAAAITRALDTYGGAAALMTFDPDLLAMLRQALKTTPLGILAGGEERTTPLVTRFGRDMLLHMARTQPDFISYYVTALPHPATTLGRRKRPVLTWTVRSRAEADRVSRYCDQIIFEDFLA